MGRAVAYRDAGVNIDMQTIRSRNFDLVVVVNDVATSPGFDRPQGGGIAYPGQLGEDMDIEMGQAAAGG